MSGIHLLEWAHNLLAQSRKILNMPQMYLLKGDKGQYGAPIYESTNKKSNNSRIIQIFDSKGEFVSKLPRLLQQCGIERAQ